MSIEGEWGAGMRYPIANFRLLYTEALGVLLRRCQPQLPRSGGFRCMDHSVDSYFNDPFLE